VHRGGFHYKDCEEARSAKHNKCDFISVDQVAFNVGMLSVYAMGAMENYTYMLMNVTCLAIPVIFVLQFLWMPETPQYLLSKDNREGAAKSLRWLRGKCHDVQTELQQLKVSDLQLQHDNLHLHAAVTKYLTTQSHTEIPHYSVPHSNT
jgi:hypothetical protein